MHTLAWGDLVDKKRKKQEQKIVVCPHCKREFEPLGKERNCHYEDCLAERDAKIREKNAARALERYRRRKGTQ